MLPLIPVNTEFIPLGSKEVLFGDGLTRFPMGFSNGDAFRTADYIYTYIILYHAWGVRVRDKTKTSYSPLMAVIGGVPLISIDQAFKSCGNMEKAPAIPDTVKFMSSAFFDCKSLKEAPTIPNSVWSMNKAFAYCQSMTTAPVIPESVAKMQGTFLCCKSLTGTLVCNAKNINLQMYDSTLAGTQITEIAGTCSNKAKEVLLATKNK